MVELLNLGIGLEYSSLQGSSLESGHFRAPFKFWDQRLGPKYQVSWSFTKSALADLGSRSFVIFFHWTIDLSLCPGAFLVIDFESMHSTKSSYDLIITNPLFSKTVENW